MRLELIAETNGKGLNSRSIQNMAAVNLMKNPKYLRTWLYLLKV